MMQPDIRDDIGFFAWVSLAPPGAAVSYHRGFLAVDAVSLVSKLPASQQRSLRMIASPKTVVIGVRLTTSIEAPARAINRPVSTRFL